MDKHISFIPEAGEIWRYEGPDGDHELWAIDYVKWDNNLLVCRMERWDEGYDHESLESFPVSYLNEDDGCWTYVETMISDG
jgi:hypothetical protein